MNLDILLTNYLNNSGVGKDIKIKFLIDLMKGDSFINEQRIDLIIPFMEKNKCSFSTAIDYAKNYQFPVIPENVEVLTEEERWECLFYDLLGNEFETDFTLDESDIGNTDYKYLCNKYFPGESI